MKLGFVRDFVTVDFFLSWLDPGFFPSNIWMEYDPFRSWKAFKDPGLVFDPDHGESHGDGSHLTIKTQG